MSLLKTVKLFTANRAVGLTFVRNHWNKDWKPGKYPTTEEEMANAARKYGLRRADYKPYPDDGYGFGDYPDLGMTSAESRDPFYPWDYPEYRRNFNEPMHALDNIYGEDRYNICMKQRFSTVSMLSAFLGALLLSLGLYILTDDACFLPVMPKYTYNSEVKRYGYEC